MLRKLWTTYTASFHVQREWPCCFVQASSPCGAAALQVLVRELHSALFPNVLDSEHDRPLCATRKPAAEAGAGLHGLAPVLQVSPAAAVSLDPHRLPPC